MVMNRIYDGMTLDVEWSISMGIYVKHHLIPWRLQPVQQVRDRLLTAKACAEGVLDPPYLRKRIRPFRHELGGQDDEALTSSDVAVISTQERVYTWSCLSMMLSDVLQRVYHQHRASRALADQKLLRVY